MTTYPTITGLVVLAGSVVLRQPFDSPLPVSGPVEPSPFVLGGAQWLSLARNPLEHTAGYSATDGRVVVPPSAFREGRSVQVWANGVLVATITNWNFIDTNLDGFVDAADLDEFTRLWLVADVQSDANNDGFSDALDYDLWMSAWLGGGR